VTLSKKGAAHFKSDKVEYYIVLETTSTFWFERIILC
jgi:hypothetical protein